MDIIAHGLWPVLIYKAIAKDKSKFKMKLVVFWGIFPDVFAFFISSIWIVQQLFMGSISIFEAPRPDTNDPYLLANVNAFKASYYLYHVSHSLIIFLIAFVIACVFSKRIVYEMFAWLIHLACDLLVHPIGNYDYATQIFWPLSKWRVDGVQYEQPLYIGLNYALIIIFWLWLRKKRLQTKF